MQVSGPLHSASPPVVVIREPRGDPEADLPYVHFVDLSAGEASRALVGGDAPITELVLAVQLHRRVADSALVAGHRERNVVAAVRRRRCAGEEEADLLHVDRSLAVSDPYLGDSPSACT